MPALVAGIFLWIHRALARRQDNLRAGRIIAVAAGLIAILLSTIAPGAMAATVVAGIPTIIDGDTLSIGGQRIRLHGIDAPESLQQCQAQDGRVWECGQHAAQALREYIGRQILTCDITGIDRYSRAIARCNISGKDINAWMVANGWAVAYRRYSLDYTQHEEAARSFRQAIWSGDFVMPWDWRRGHRMNFGPASSSSTNARCAIKGNIGSTGERIYHVPGGRWYKRTGISKLKGERWFCSEEEARAAGWRPAAQ
jgi:endonuclease YncB( thermonuclease family)